MIYWNPDPYLMTIGFLTIRWYGLIFATAFIVGLLIMQRIYAMEGRNSQELDNLLICLLIGTVIGARLAHCLFYDPVFYLNRPIRILMIWEGGLASHGGGIGLLLAMAYYVRKTGNMNYLWLVDRIAIPTALGGCFIRIANFVNSEIVGLPTHADWGIIFMRFDIIPRHPVQLYESAAYLVVCILLISLYRWYEKKPPHGMLTGLFLILVFCSRFLLEFYKTPQAAFHLNKLTMGQLLSLPFIIVGMIVLLRAIVFSHSQTEQGSDRYSA